LIRGHGITISAGIISVALALFGALIVLAASASLVLIASTSHLIFTRDAGTVAFEFFRDEVNDMHCDAGRILIQWDQSPDTPVRYRCPRGYMLNRHASVPFLPWPDYSEGYSADLAVALHEMLENAQKP